MASGGLRLGPCCLEPVASKDESLWFHNICNFSTTPPDDVRDDYQEIVVVDHNIDDESLVTTGPIPSTSDKDVRDVDSGISISPQPHEQLKSYEKEYSSTINVGATKNKTANRNEIMTTSNDSKSYKKKQQTQSKKDKNTSPPEEDNEITVEENNTTMSNNYDDDTSVTGFSVMSDCSLKSLHSTLNKYNINDTNEYIDNDVSTLFEHRKKKKKPMFNYITNTYAYRTTFAYNLSFLKDEENDNDKSTCSKEEKKKKLIEIKDHKEALALTASCMGRNHKLVADKLNIIGDCYYNMKEYDLALKSYLEGLSIYSVKVGDDQPECMITRMNIGKMQLLRNELEDCLEAYSHALYMKNALGCNDVYVGEIHEVLSYVHHRRCENTEALKDLKRALRTYRDLFGDDDTKVIHTVVSIGKSFS